jgi:hypothetical protein
MDSLIDFGARMLSDFLLVFCAGRSYLLKKLIDFLAQEEDYRSRLNSDSVMGQSSVQFQFQSLKNT